MPRFKPWNPQPTGSASETLIRWLGDFAQDLRHAARQFARAPGLATLIVVTLAIGIGATVTMAGVIDRLLFRGPAEVHESGRLARLVGVTPGAPKAGGYFSYPFVLDVAEQVSSFAEVAAWTGATLPLGRGPDAREVGTELVSAGYFPLLRVRPALGRFFGPGDGFPVGAGDGGPPVAVLSHALWKDSFGGDSGVVGSSVQFGQLIYTVVGIAPPGFRGLGPDAPDAWLPLTVAASVESRPFILQDDGAAWISVVGRLRPGATHQLAGAQATAVNRRYQPNLPQYEESRIVAASVIRGRAPDRPREVNVALWLAGVSSFVLLIACANVTNLLLARAFVRRREIAVRLALGAGRWRLARQLLAEAGLLAALGAVGAMTIAGVGTGLILKNLEMDTVGPIVDARLLTVTMLVALGVTLAVGLAPMVLSAFPDLSHVLRSGASSGGGRTSRSRSMLLGTQAAICMLLLVVAGLFAQSLRRVTGLDLGLEPGQTLMVSFDIKGAMSTDERNATYAALREHVEAIPGVERIAFADGGSRAVQVRAGRLDTSEHMRRTWGAPHELPVDSGYFRILGSSIRGRDFTSSDVRGAPPVAIVNAPLAALLFPGEEALGQCVYLTIMASEPGEVCFTIVGVLDGFIYGPSILNREGLLVYTPLAQRRFGLDRPGQMMIALDGPAAAVAPAIRHTILGLHPDLPQVRIRWMQDVVEQEFRPWRVAASMFSLFGLVALAVAAVGLYAVVSFAAAQRTPEIAVRLALGARLRDVMRLVAGEGLLAVMVGLAVGAGGALVARRWIGPLLFQTSPSDPEVMVGVAALLVGVALVAAAWPTLRAARLDPARVLRED